MDTGIHPPDHLPMRYTCLGQLGLQWRPAGAVSCRLYKRVRIDRLGSDPGSLHLRLAAPKCMLFSLKCCLANFLGMETSYDIPAQADGERNLAARSNVSPEPFVHHHL